MLKSLLVYLKLRKISRLQKKVVRSLARHNKMADRAFEVMEREVKEIQRLCGVRSVPTKAESIRAEMVKAYNHASMN